MNQDQIQEILKAVDEIVKTRIESSNESMMAYLEIKQKELLDVFNDQYVDNQEEFKSVKGEFEKVHNEFDWVKSELNSLKTKSDLHDSDLKFIKDMLKDNILMRLEALESVK
jgi:hypothetical protein